MAWQVTTVTVPAEAATMVVPGGAAMSSPWWVGLCGVRNPETIGPWTGWVQGPAAPQAVSAALRHSADFGCRFRELTSNRERGAVSVPGHWSNVVLRDLEQ